MLLDLGFWQKIGGKKIRMKTRGGFWIWQEDFGQENEEEDLVLFLFPFYERPTTLGLLL